MKISAITNKINFKSYKGAIQEWEKSKPVFNKALKELGDKKITLIAQGTAFPSENEENIGVGSPYSKGAANLKGFFDGMIETAMLGPWGKTTKGNADYSMHSPYLSTTDSLNPFFINFKFLTTEKGGSLLKEETLLNLAKNYTPARSKTGNIEVDYIYAQNAIDIMLDEIYKTHKHKLKNRDKTAIKQEKEFNQFKKENKNITLDVIYDILIKENNGANYRNWNTLDKNLPILLEENNPEAQERFEELYDKYKEEIEKYEFTQFIAHKQAQNPKFNHFDYIADKQVAIFGADEWKMQDVILDEIQGKKVTLGTPGDDFSQHGRNWGMAVLDYTKLFDENGNLTPKGQKVKKIYQNVFKNNKGGLRIDHFIGIIDPYVCLDGIGAGRLYSSPEHPLLKNYAYKGGEEEKNEQYSRFFEKMILDSAKEFGLDESNIFPEDLGTITPAVEHVLDKYNLSRMKITQFINPDDYNHKYHPKNAHKKDIITTGTHDTPSEITYIANLDRNSYPKRTKMLSDITGQDEKILYEFDGKGKKNALQAEFASLFTAESENVHIFFPTFFGIDEYYNKPGDKSVNRWRVRIPDDFQKTYFKNLKHNTAFNPYSALSTALIKKGTNDKELIEELKKHEEKLFFEIDDMIKKESKTSAYNPFVNGLETIEKRNELFPKDAQYREKLAHALGIKNSKDLSAVTGEEELKAILANVQKRYFHSPKEIGHEFYFDDGYRINLHLHTNYSDGLMSVEETLDKAQDYAEKSGKPFVFAISDHDNIESTKEAIEIIAKNPQKYDQILFVPAVEMNTKYQNKKITRKDLPNHAFQMETVGYCFNPFDKEINDFINTKKAQNEKYVAQIIESFKKEGLDVSLKEAKSLQKDEGRKSHLSQMGSPGILDDLRMYIDSKIEKIENQTRKEELKQKLKETFDNHIFNHGSKNLMPETPSQKEIIDVVKRSGGFCAIAHPAKINLSGIDVSGDEGIKTILDDFIKSGGDSIEYHYQYGSARGNQGMIDWINLINDYYALKYPNHTGTGGLDNHGLTIFKR